MKFRFLVKIIAKILNMNINEETPRADMYLPNWLMAFGLVLISGGIGFSIAFAITLKMWMIPVAAGAVLLGIAAIMCWKNQTVRVISEEKFEYTTFLGNTYEYYFKDITALRRNSDSMTLFVNGKKVHMEGMAIISDRLVELINKNLP